MPGTFIALTLFAAIAAAVPEIGIFVAVPVIAYLLYTGAAQDAANWVGSVVGPGNKGPMVQPYAPLGPTLPGWSPPAQGPLPKF